MRIPALLILSACSQAKTGLPGLAYEGDVSFTVEGAPSGPEDISLSMVGFSQIAEDDVAVVAAMDPDGIYRLILVLPVEATAGQTTPTQIVYHKGLQALLDADATCVVDLSEVENADQKWEGDFSCTGLRAEGDPATEWAISDGHFSGGHFSGLDTRAELFTTVGVDFDVEIESAPLEGVVIDQQDPDRALVIPWQNNQIWLMMEDGADDSRDDVIFELDPADGEIGVSRWSRAEANADSPVTMRLSSELEITAGLDGGELEVTGTDLAVDLWGGLQEDPADLVVRYR